MILFWVDFNQYLTCFFLEPLGPIVAFLTLLILTEPSYFSTMTHCTLGWNPKEVDQNWWGTILIFFSNGVFQILGWPEENNDKNSKEYLYIFHFLPNVHYSIHKYTILNNVISTTRRKVTTRSAFIFVFSPSHHCND